MTPITASPKQGVDLLIVSVPESWKHWNDIEVRNHFLYCGPSSIRVPITPGSYTFLFCSLSATEEQAREILEYILAPFSDDILGYEDYQSIGFLTKDTALESLHSLLRSLGLEPSRNYAIIKIETP